MFAKGKAIREAKKAEVLAKAKEEERRRIEAVLIRHGVQLDKEVVDEVFGDARPG